jgi:hypothetical protein
MFGDSSRATVPALADRIWNRALRRSERLPTPAVSPRSIEGDEGLHRSQSISQAARKGLTRSRTKLGTSFRRYFASCPVLARISIGTRMRSKNICALARLRLLLKGPFGSHRSVLIALFRT